MNIKLKKIVIIFGLLVLIFTIVLLRGKDKSEEKEEEVLISPTPTEVEVVEVKSETGALYISPTEEEILLDYSFGSLRDKCPIETDDFVVDFDYKKLTFVVTTDNEDSFWMWLDENGYIIPVEDFVIEK